MIKIENLTKYYYSTNSVTCALRKINLEFKRGEFIAITGESGSGKTTLLNVISGFDTYEEGEIYFKGKPTSFYSKEDFENYRKSEIAFIFQNYNLIDSFSVFENVFVAFIIDGVKKDKARKKTYELLEKVGLLKEASKKATKLSGGQRQRLAIARALAKSTDIIVADEPTGNLDVENGKQIMQLLKDISKDKLVIVVTHNQEEVMPFITRKIRLHDGSVVSDEIIEEINSVEKNEKTKQNKNSFSDSWKLFLLNFKSQPKRTILIYLLTFIISITSFIFIGVFFQNLDDTKTRILSDEVFLNHDQTRLIITPNEERTINDSDIAKAKVKNVYQVEKYQYITDVNYYTEKDYKVKSYGGYVENPSGAPSGVIKTSTTLTDHTHFMRSASSLKKSDLKAGKLPENDLEMVLYSDDKSVIGTTKKILFANRATFSKDSYLEYDVKIVGLLKDKTEQIYFSEDLCEVLTLTKFKFEITSHYNVKDKNGITKNQKLTFTSAVLDYNLKDNQISLPTAKQQAIKTLIDSNSIPTYNGIVIMNTFFLYREAQNVIIDKNKQTDVNITSSVSNDPLTIGLSKDLFRYFYDSIVNEKELAVFANDYSYIDEVMAELSKQGFMSISCYRVSATSYDLKKVAERFITLFICIIAQVIIGFVLYAICLALMKLRKKEYLIYKMIGLTEKMSNLATYLEMISFTVLSLISVIILSVTIKYTTNSSYLIEFFKYIRWYHYLICFVCILIIMMGVSKKFNKFISKKTDMATLLKED